MGFPLVDRDQIRIKMMLRSFRDTASLYKPTQTVGVAGENIDTFVEVETGIKGALQSSWGYERIFQRRPVGEATHVFICEVPTNEVSAGCRLYINSVWYEIVVVDKITGEGIYLEIQLSETV